MDILDLVEVYQLEKVVIYDFNCLLGLQIPRLQLHFYNNTSSNLEVINIEDLKIREFARFSCFHIINKRVGLITE